MHDRERAATEEEQGLEALMGAGPEAAAPSSPPRRTLADLFGPQPWPLVADPDDAAAVQEPVAESAPDPSPPPEALPPEPVAVPDLTEPPSADRPEREVPVALGLGGALPPQHAFGAEAVAESAAWSRVPAPPARLRRKALWAIACANVALVAVLAGVPAGRAADEARQRPPRDQAPAAVDPRDLPVAPLGEPAPAAALVPDGDLYDAAQQAIARGDYATAAEQLSRYLTRNHELSAFARQAVYGSLQHCMLRLGRDDLAAIYAARADNLRHRSASPAELLHAAERAAAAGRGADARRALARFLLQQDELEGEWATPARRRDALLRMGEAFRQDLDREAAK